MKFSRLSAVLVSAALVSVLPAATAVAQPEPEKPAKAATPTDELRPDPSLMPSVVNGEKTTVKEHPFVITGMRVGGGGPQGQSCTAAIVGKRTILTAAHCMVDSEGEKSYVYGDDDLNTPGDETFKSKVVEYKEHPEYGGSGGWQQGHDVAIVTIADDVPIPEDEFAKIATSQDSALTEPGKKGFALGYGKTGPNGGSGVLAKANMPVNDPQNCQVFDTQVKPDQMVCTGFDDGHIATCSGDSGGPFIVDGVVVGVVSWGASECNRYSIMAKLTGELGDWATEQVQAQEAKAATQY